MDVSDCNHRPIGTFNPVCRSRPRSITWCRNDDIVPSSSSSSSSSHEKRKKIQRRIGSVRDEPLSPRVGCVGQVRTGKAESNGSPVNKINKFFNLKKILSGRSTAIAVAMATSRGHSSAIPKVSVVDLDPPLPVTKHVARDSNSVSLWARRCGQGLECLQLHQQQQCTK